MILPGQGLRQLGLSEDIVWSCWFFSYGFSSTLHELKSGYRLNRLLAAYVKDVSTMAKKPVTSRDSYAKSSSASVQWVNVNLSNQDIDAIAAWLSEEPDLLTEYFRLVTSGFALGIKPARDGDGFMATIISDTPASGGQSYGLSAYAPSPYDALGVLLYKFVTLLGGEFAEGSVSRRSGYR